MLTLILVSILSAITCAVIADSKNRDPIAYGALGLAIGVFGIVIVACLPAK